MEPVDTSDLKSEAFARAGSSPAVLTRVFCGLVGAVLLASCGTAPAKIGSFGDFSPPGQPHYLACPQNYCLATPDEVTPLMPLPAAELRGVVHEILAQEASATLVSSDNEGLRLVYRQRTSDGVCAVTLDVVDADEGASGIAVYSQSETGNRDADRTTVRRLLDRIATTAASRVADDKRSRP